MIHGRKIGSHEHKSNSTRRTHNNGHIHKQSYLNSRQIWTSDKPRQTSRFVGHKNGSKASSVEEPTIHFDNFTSELGHLLKEIECDESRSFVHKLHTMPRKAPRNSRLVEFSHDHDLLKVTVFSSLGQNCKQAQDRDSSRILKRAESYAGLIDEYEDYSFISIPKRMQPKHSSIRYKPTSDLQSFGNRSFRNCNRVPKGHVFESQNSIGTLKGNVLKCMIGKTSKSLNDTSTSTSDYHSTSLTDSGHGTMGVDSRASINIPTNGAFIEIEDQDLDDLRLKVDLNDYTVESPISANLLDVRKGKQDSKVIIKKSKTPLIIVDPREENLTKSKDDGETHRDSIR